MLLQNKRVLVTGAGGFIGSHLVEALLEKEADVVAMVRYNGRNDWGMLSDLPIKCQKSIHVLSGDIRDPFFLRKAVEGCEYVFHLAALIGIPYSYIAPADYVSVNIQGTMNVLQACRDEGVPRVVHTSTSEVYGTAKYIPIDEKHLLQGQSPYSASKIGADKIAESYYTSFCVPVVTVRPFNTYGPRQSARAFIPTIISQALTQDRLTMGALDPIRDLTFVKDTVDGLIEVGLSDNDEVVGRTINLGTGIGYTIEDVIKSILALLGKKDLPIEQASDRMRPEKSEVMRLVCDNRLAGKMCKWQPKYSLKDGLLETVKWIRKSLDMYRPDCYVV